MCTYITSRTSGEFVLSSDTVIPTFAQAYRHEADHAQFSEAENEEFGTIRYTIGGMILWPGNQIDREDDHQRRPWVEAGGSPDRMDLTLECIRRHYQGGRSPLGDVLARYSDFFALFGDFRGYVDFFLLQDLVTDDYLAVRCFMPFDDFKPPSLPQDVATYSEYRRLSIEFIRARNRRIDDVAIGSASAPAQQEAPPISQQGHDIEPHRPPTFDGGDIDRAVH